MQLPESFIENLNNRKAPVLHFQRATQGLFLFECRLFADFSAGLLWVLGAFRRPFPAQTKQENPPESLDNPRNQTGFALVGAAGFEPTAS